jgi:hypothetical protein
MREPFVRAQIVPFFFLFHFWIGMYSSGSEDLSERMSTEGTLNKRISKYYNVRPAIYPLNSVFCEF